MSHARDPERTGDRCGCHEQCCLADESVGQHGAVRHTEDEHSRLVDVDRAFDVGDNLFDEADIVNAVQRSRATARPGVPETIQSVGKAATKPPRSAAASPTEAFLGLVSAAKCTVQHHDQRGRNPQTGRPVQVVAAVTDPMDVRSGGRALALRDAHPLHPGVSGVGAAHCLTAGSRAELAFLGQQAECPDAWFGGGIGMPGHTENGSACDEDRQDEGAHFHGLDGSSSAW